MGAGKSTVGPLVAARLGLPFVDLDAAVEGRLGCSIAACFARAGEAAFREAERAELGAQVLGPPRVIALGGGTWHAAGCRDLLAARYRVVSLLVERSVARGRIGDRPLAAQADALYSAREAGYLEADAVVPVGELAPDALADRICAALEEL